MSDDNDTSDTQPDDSLGGARLAAARRALQIPLVEIAKELHLDEYKLRALELNDFDVLGAPVFTKGYLRKFAQLVGVAEEDVMADYYRLSRGSGPPPLVPTPARPREASSPAPWLVAVVVVVIAVIAYWWFATGEVTPAPVVTGEVAAFVEDLVTSEPEETVVLEPPVAPRQDAEPVPTNSSAISLSLTYSGDCWTEITDANGQRLFFDMGTAGRTVNLTGDGPFNVLFGNADNVSLTVNGAVFDIPAANRRGQTARLTIARP